MAVQKYELAYAAGGQPSTRVEAGEVVEMDAEKAQRVNAKLPKPLYVPVGTLEKLAKADSMRAEAEKLSADPSAAPKKRRGRPPSQ